MISLAELFYLKSGAKRCRPVLEARRRRHPLLPRHRALLFEPLEARLLLSATLPEPLLPASAAPLVTEAVSPGQLFSLDVDGNGATEAETDGRILLRYLAGLPDSQLLSGGILGGGATRDTAQAIRAYLDAAKQAVPSPLDADGNGTLSALTDGRLLYRYLQNAPDPQLIGGTVLGEGATRATALTTVREYASSKTESS